MSKTVERFEKQVQKKLAKAERFKKNLEALKSVPRALESYITMCHGNFPGSPDLDRVIERIWNMKYDFEVHDGVVSYRSEFAECVFSFDPTKRPLGWRTPEEPTTVGGVVRT